MYICICKAVSQTRLSEAISQGASTVDAVSAATGAGTDCGGCRGKISRELNRARECSGCAVWNEAASAAQEGT